MRRCEKGEEDILVTLATSLTPREEVNEVLIAILPPKQPRQIMSMPPPTVKEYESLLVASFDGSARTERKEDRTVQSYGSCWNGL